MKLYTIGFQPAYDEDLATGNADAIVVGAGKYVWHDIAGARKFLRESQKLWYAVYEMDVVYPVFRKDEKTPFVLCGWNRAKITKRVWPLRENLYDN